MLKFAEEYVTYTYSTCYVYIHTSITGKGVLTFADGERYEGELRDGRMQVLVCVLVCVCVCACVRECVRQ